jgi:hypothetical protein
LFFAPLREKDLPHRGMFMKLKLAITSLLLLSSTGCIVVGGYSSDRGWFIWPGTIVLLVVGLILFLLFKRRA